MMRVFAFGEVEVCPPLPIMLCSLAWGSAVSCVLFVARAAGLTFDGLSLVESSTVWSR